MINLYLIDSYDRKNSGLATYVNQLSDHFVNDSRLTLHTGQGRRPFEKEGIDGRIVHYVPFDIALRDNSKYDGQLIDFLIKETKNKEQVIFHFNWVNHAPFAQLLKKSIKCKTVLTKHCIPWRDLVTDHYPMFRRLDRQLVGKESTDYLAHPVDDGSTDGTAALLETYKDDRIITIRNEVNRGIVDCLNSGVKSARGKYVARLDADDLMHEDRLHKQMLFLEGNGNTGIVMVGSHHHVINHGGQVVGLKQYPLSHEEITSVLLFQNPFSHPSLMIRTDVLKRIRYSGKFRHAEGNTF